jgi:hypothetical protein
MVVNHATRFWKRAVEDLWLGDRQGTGRSQMRVLPVGKDRLSRFAFPRRICGWTDKLQTEMTKPILYIYWMGMCRPSINLALVSLVSVDGIGH